MSAIIIPFPAPVRRPECTENVIVRTMGRLAAAIEKDRAAEDDDEISRIMDRFALRKELIRRGEPSETIESTMKVFGEAPPHIRAHYLQAVKEGKA